MIAWWLALSLASAAPPDVPALEPLPELPPAPRVVDPVAGECARSFDLVVGRPVPPALVDARGLVVCAATAVPPSVLVQAVTDAEALPPTRVLHHEHVYQKHEEARYWRDRAVAAERPPAWYDRPGVQRWAGRIETLVAVAAAIVVVREAAGR